MLKLRALKTRSSLLLIAASSIGAAFAWQQQVASKLPDAKLPEPYATPSSRNNPRVVSRPDGAQLQVPAGFTVEEFATDLDKPRIMLNGPSGEILVTESKPNGTVTILIDKNGDFKADSSKKLIEGLDRPYGMVWLNDWLYVGEVTSVKRYKYDAKNMTVGKGQEIFSMPYAGGGGHWTRSLAIDSKGQYLFIGVGSGSNVNTGEPEGRAAIHRCTVEGKNCEIYASGTRNPTSIHMAPNSDVLWASIQERDELGDDLVPDYLTHITRGAFYGWPYAYFGPHEDPRHKGEAPAKVKATVTPDINLGAHVAVIDWNFYTGKMFPKEYQGGVFAAFHGSWNRSKRVGQSVAFIPFRNGRPAGPPTEFLKGWMLGPDKREVWGRPTGIFVMKDGSLLVSDDGGNKIWRISYKG